MSLMSRLKAILKAARAHQADTGPWDRTVGIGQDWRPTAYGEYITKSVPVYAAIRLRAEALARVPWIFRRLTSNGGSELINDNHPLAKFMSRPNPDMTGAELRRATEINLCLWGVAFWVIEQGPDGPELWPVRPDRMTVLPGQGQRYIQGYIYNGALRQVTYLPEEVEMFRFFNPLQDRTGLSPIAPLRLVLDMGLDAQKYNRNTFRNGAMPDYVLLANEMMTDSQAEAFYRRWEARFQGPDRAHPQPLPAPSATSRPWLSASGRWSSSRA